MLVFKQVNIVHAHGKNGLTPPISGACTSGHKGKCFMYITSTPTTSVWRKALGMKMDQNKVLAGMTESPAAGELQRMVSPS